MSGVKYKRVVIKISGEALAGKSGFGIDDKILSDVVDQLITVRNMGVQIGLVLGAGNFWRGRQGRDMNRVTADKMGMVATVINALAVADAFCRKGVKAVVQTAVSMTAIAEEFSVQKADERLNDGEVLVFACGTGNPYYSTDTGATLRAAEIEADVLLCAKNVDGLYDSDPRVNANATLIKDITHAEVIARDLKAMDLSAHIMCQDAKLNILVFGLNEKNSIVKAVTGEEIGTYVHN